MANDESFLRLTYALIEIVFPRLRTWKYFHSLDWFFIGRRIPVLSGIKFIRSDPDLSCPHAWIPSPALLRDSLITNQDSPATQLPFTAERCSRFRRFLHSREKCVYFLCRAFKSRRKAFWASVNGIKSKWSRLKSGKQRHLEERDLHKSHHFTIKSYSGPDLA